MQLTDRVPGYPGGRLSQGDKLENIRALLSHDRLGNIEPVRQVCLGLVQGHGEGCFEIIGNQVGCVGIFKGQDVTGLLHRCQLVSGAMRQQRPYASKIADARLNGKSR